jgi:predicted O-methyltransferase YrrM
MAVSGVAMGNSLFNERISARCMMAARARVAALDFLFIDYDKDAYLADLHSIMARGY